MRRTVRQSWLTEDIKIFKSLLGFPIRYTSSRRGTRYRSPDRTHQSREVVYSTIHGTCKSPRFSYDDGTIAAGAQDPMHLFPAVSHILNVVVDRAKSPTFVARSDFAIPIFLK